ncbi:hypothetical protein [Aquiflexum lacus]|uniref:hypothetical protein n=1 Tax=Aquiflexum lacus TaxID=2483805 RepID=UPI001894BF78|nr:hypothetical protein [Aquiflexum lacus]
MRFLKTVLFALFLLLGYNSNAQVTYTTSGTCSPTMTNYLTTASCWVRTGSCSPNPPATPPSNGSSGCPVTIVINHEVNLASLTVGSFTTVRVNSGGKLNISGNLTKTVDTEGSIFVNGGEIAVSGNLILPSGKNTANTKLNIDIRNGGSFNITGGLLDIENNAQLVIDGDGDATSILSVKSFNFGQRSKVDILVGGGLFVEGDVDYRGNNSEINVTGFFRTGGSVIITGGSGNQLNAYGNAQIMIEKNLDVRGTSDITFGGTSETDIGGDIITVGSAKVIATEQAQVFVCGTFPVPCNDNNCNTQEIIQGTFAASCRIMPVEYVYTKAQFNANIRSNSIFWATGKEVENSHFEIERSIGNITDFRVVATVDGMGWSDNVTEYSFEDLSLPLNEIVVYYRINQFDFDGKVTVGKVMSVRLTSSNQNMVNVWKVYPNPLVGGERLNIKLTDFKAYTGETITVKILSSTSAAFQVQARSESELNEVLSVLVARVPRGVLMIEIQWGQQVEHFKLLKK